MYPAVIFTLFRESQRLTFCYFCIGSFFFCIVAAEGETELLSKCYKCIKKSTKELDESCKIKT